MSRYYASDPEGLEQTPPSVCSRFLRYTWKTITCLFSHITLVSMVVSYCILGAFTFESLEQAHEKEVKRNISRMRNNITDQLWLLTESQNVLKEENMTLMIVERLRGFEKAILDAITRDGWDGDENTDKVQWSLAGALFYSIIVITTIGYGHIAPKTPWGKVVTIFYAILGIPLMLLCLSNIGDIMATSFRFLYWKICCYVCTKRPKRPKRTRSNRGTLRIPANRQWRSRTASFRRSARTSTRSADSGFEVSEIGPTSYSDTELRYHDDMPPLRNPKQERTSQRSRYSDTNVPSKSNATSRQNLRGGSLDRRRPPRNFETVLDAALLSKTPVLCNKYVVEQNDAVANHVAVSGNRFERHSERHNRHNMPSPVSARRAVSMPRSNYLEPPREPSPPSSYRDEVDSVKDSRRRRRQQQQYNPSPRIMSPLGYGHRSKYLDDSDYDEEYYDEYFDSARARTKPVPIWLCVFLVVSYIIAGTFLFHTWEGWDYLDSAYFCFITLTTIGFGDLFPAKRVKDGEEFKQNIAFCSLYLLFGIALLAMSFNLVQEEVIASVKRVAKTLGIIKHEEDEDEED